MAGVAVRNNTQLKKKAARTRLKHEKASAAKQQRLETVQTKKKIAKAKKPAGKRPPKGLGSSSVFSSYF